MSDLLVGRLFSSLVGQTGGLSLDCDQKTMTDLKMPGLTIFSAPKPFRKPFDVIQRNAIQSWCRLQPKCQVILFGSDDGIAEAAAEFQVQHVPSVTCNEFGTPLLSDMFQKAQALASHPIMCYVNADIILLNDLLDAVARVRRKRYLLLGRRWMLDLSEPIDFADPSWPVRLCALAHRQGALEPEAVAGLDYFVFPRGLYDQIPPFAVGRAGWDNWMVYAARSRRIPVIDATESVLVIHQNHDYLHHPQGIDGTRRGIEAERNIELAGGLSHCFRWTDATWLLGSGGICPAVSLEHLRRRWKTLYALYPQGGLRVKITEVLLAAIIGEFDVRWVRSWVRKGVAVVRRKWTGA